MRNTCERRTENTDDDRRRHPDGGDRGGSGGGGGRRRRRQRSNAAKMAHVNDDVDVVVGKSTPNKDSGTKIHPNKADVQQAAVFEGRKKARDYVVEDRIIREIVEKEFNSIRHFERYWSCFRAENLDKIYQQLLHDHPMDFNLLQREPEKTRSSRKSSTRRAPVSRESLPTSTSGFIGWRSTKPEFNLEIFGSPPPPTARMKSRGRGTINKDQFYSLCLG